MEFNWRKIKYDFYFKFLKSFWVCKNYTGCKRKLLKSGNTFMIKKENRKKIKFEHILEFLKNISFVSITNKIIIRLHKSLDK